MKHLAYIITLVAIILPLNVNVAQSFEGKIKIINENKPSNVVEVIVKNGKSAIEMQSNGRHAKVITEGSTKTTLIENHGQKVAFISSTDKKQDGDLGYLIEFVNDQITYKDTEESIVIEGYHCTKHTATSDHYIVEAWITNDINVSILDVLTNRKSQENTSSDPHATMWEKGFVMKYQILNRATGEKNTVSYLPQEEIVNDSYFKYSNEYRVLDSGILNLLVEEARTDAEKMKELRSLMQVLNSN